MFSSKYWLTAFALLISMGMLIFYLHAQSIELEIGKVDQILRAELVRKKFDQFVIASNLLNRFIQEDISGKTLKVNEIEDKLQQYLRSSPSDIIFGVGIWYEPFQFRKNQKWFGPYVHRPSPSSPDQANVLTYEWNTAEYNYPTQDWYKHGLNNRGESYFVNPYFDNGLVYVTNARAFFNKEKKTIGVISIDLVLPQLQNIINLANQSNQEMIYIVDRMGMLLAHPFKEQFFKIKKIAEKDNQSLLNYRAEDVQFSLNLQQQKWLKSEVVQDQLGWKVVVISSKDKLLDGFQNLKRLLFTVFFLFWIIVIIIWKVLTISEKKQKINEKEIEAARIQLIQSSKMASLGEMAGGIAHEINNPITIISSANRILRKSLEKGITDPEFYTKTLDTIDNTVTRISTIISGLRTVSRDGTNEEFKHEKLADIFSDILGLCGEKFKNNGVELRIDLENEIYQTSINCGRVQLSQVFLNLLDNSYDAIEKLSEKWIKIDCHKRDEKLIIRFTDSGPGIPQAIQEKILNPFFTTKEIGKGTGLGLSIANSIIKNHGGQLYVDNDSKNTCLVLSLPIS